MSRDAKIKSGVAFSVVVPAYNAAATIEAALASCLHQRFQPLEIIVVDDRSRDETASIVRRQSSELIRLISLPENNGPSAARNAGMDVARGTHIAFLDADDVWHPEKLAVMAAGIREHPDGVLWFHDFTTKLFVRKKSFAIVWRRLSFAKLLLRNVITPSCTVVAATELRFQERMRYCEDYDLWVRMEQQGPLYHLPMLLTQRMRPMLSAGGQSSNRWQMRKGELKVYTQLALRRKSILPLLPFLWFYSLTKHALKLIK